MLVLCAVVLLVSKQGSKIAVYNLHGAIECVHAQSNWLQKCCWPCPHCQLSFCKPELLV